MIFTIVTSGAALIFAGSIAGTSLLPQVAAGGLGLLGIGNIFSVSKSTDSKLPVTLRRRLGNLEFTLKNGTGTWTRLVVKV